MKYRRRFSRLKWTNIKASVTGPLSGFRPSPVDSPHKGPVTRKMFPCHDVIIVWSCLGAYLVPEHQRCRPVAAYQEGCRNIINIHSGAISRRVRKNSVQTTSDEMLCCKISEWRDSGLIFSIVMMTSSNGNMFRVTDHLCGEFTDPRWIPRHKGQRRGALMFSLICTRINGWVNNGEASDLRRHRAYFDVIVMSWNLTNVSATLLLTRRIENVSAIRVFHF